MFSPTDFFYSGVIYVTYITFNLNLVAFNVFSVVQLPSISVSKILSPQSTLYLLSNHFPLSSPTVLRKSLTCFLCIWVCLFYAYFIHKASYVTFCVWLLLLSIMLWRFMHVAPYIRMSFFLWLDNISSCLYK